MGGTEGAFITEESYPLLALLLLLLLVLGTPLLLAPFMCVAAGVRAEGVDTAICKACCCCGTAVMRLYTRCTAVMVRAWMARCRSTFMVRSVITYACMQEMPVLSRIYNALCAEYRQYQGQNKQRYEHKLHRINIPG